METSAETWRVTFPKPKIPFKPTNSRPKPTENSKLEPTASKETPPKKPPPKECDEESPPCCVTCRVVHSKTCGSNKKKLRCQKELPIVFSSYSSLSKSVKGNSRYCCCALGRFFQEAGRVIQGDPNAKLQESLSELSEAMLAITNDCVLAIGKAACLSKDFVRYKLKLYAIQIHRKICAYIGKLRKRAKKVKEKLVKASINPDALLKYDPLAKPTPKRLVAKKSKVKRLKGKKSKGKKLRGNKPHFKKWWKRDKSWKSQSYRL